MKGYFRKRGDKWSYTVDIGKDDYGKRKQKSKGGFKTKKEAQQAAAELIHELGMGTYVDEKETLFKDFAIDWITMYWNEGRVKESTIRVREHEIALLNKYFSTLKLKDITKKNYQSALIDLQKNGYAENTIDGVHRTGRMIFKKAIELEILKLDPTEFAKVPKTKKTVEELEQEEETIKYLEKEELFHFLQIAKEKGLENDYLMFLTLAYSGMRVGELVALKWKDIDFKEHTISISKTYYNPNNNVMGYKLLPPKTKSSKRLIEVEKEVIDELDKYRSKQNIEKMKYRDIYHDEDFIFTKKKFPGYPEITKTANLRMKRLLKLAGLNENLTPHSLRHTHTSLLAEAGVGLQEIMDRLGHTDDNTTKNVYLHVTKTKKKEASQKFGQLMRNL